VNDGLTALSLTALSIGFLHTLLGPDHYVPFAAMARAGRWSLGKTMLVTILCGLGHVASSAALGIIGVAMGVAVFRLETIEALRGDIAGWLLLAFGLVYTIYGVRGAIRNRPHAHLHVHADGTIHAHEHVHDAEHLHVHRSEPVGACSSTSGAEDVPRSEPTPEDVAREVSAAPAIEAGDRSLVRRRFHATTRMVSSAIRASQHEAPGTQCAIDSPIRAEAFELGGNHGPSLPVDRREPRSGETLTPWILFTIFLFGPCEPLIPLVMYPAATGSLWGVAFVTTLFGLVTIATMCTIVAAMYAGAGMLPLAPLGRYGHAAAGVLILACGVAVMAGM
jgi:hypothetical protein